MTQWYVKGLSALTNVSVQTLHHYDRIGLLKPSYKHANGYRLYSKGDLLKLQQIIALKFFGFELSHIKTLLEGDVEMKDHLIMQASFLQNKAKTLLEASQTLESIISECGNDTSIPWQTITQLIGVYRMTQQLEKTWAGKVLTADELKQYAHFEEGLKTRFTGDQKKKFDQQWTDVVTSVRNNLDQDPTSDVGMMIAKQCMDLINGLYGKEHANLKNSIWNNGFKKGQMDDNHAMAPAMVAWLDRAIDTYYRGRLYGILDQVTASKNSPDLVLQWQALMEEMFGNATHLKQGLIEVAMSDNRVSDVARMWLKQLSL